MNYLNHPGYMHGGRVGNTLLRNVAPRGYAGGGSPSYIDAGTGAPGRADNIPADLSENEYVIDAETVALLGDGNPDAGAAKLDQMREAIRAHKGQALVEGEISEDALGPLDYIQMAGGGRVSKLGRLPKPVRLKDPIHQETLDIVFPEGVSRKELQEYIQHHYYADKATYDVDELTDVKRAARKAGIRGFKPPVQKKAGGGRVGAVRRVLDLNDPKLDVEYDNSQYKNQIQALKKRLARTKNLDLNDPSLPSRVKTKPEYQSTDARKAPNVAIEEALAAKVPTDPAARSRHQMSLHDIIMNQRRLEDRLRALTQLSDMTGTGGGPATIDDLDQYLRSFDTSGFARGGRAKMRDC